jgi:hypothetical protein
MTSPPAGVWRYNNPQDKQATTMKASGKRLTVAFKLCCEGKIKELTVVWLPLTLRLLNYKKMHKYYTIATICKSGTVK